MATEPVLHRVRIVGHHIGGAFVAHHLHARGRGLVEIGHVKSEACPRRDAHPVERNDSENQRAGGIADSVDDDALAAIADRRVFDLVLVDQTAVVAGDAVIGGRTRTPQHKWHQQRKRKTTHSPETPDKNQAPNSSPSFTWTLGKDLSVVCWDSVKAADTLLPQLQACALARGPARQAGISGVSVNRSRRRELICPRASSRIPC